MEIALMLLQLAYAKRPTQIEASDRIAQLLLLPYLKGKAAPICRTGGLRSPVKKVFWQTVINDEKPKLKFQEHDIETEGLMDAGAGVSIISQESWIPNWPFQELSTWFFRHWDIISAEIECIMD